MARWEREGIPHKGWKEIGIEDLGEDLEFGDDVENTNSAKCVDKRKYATFTFYSILILMANCVWDAYAQNT